MIDKTSLWLVIVFLGLGTFLIRFSFLGFMNGRSFSPFVMRLLKFVPVAVMPGLVAPLVVWPDATNGDIDPARIGAAIAALLIGAYSRNTLWAVIGGMAALYILMFAL